MNIQTATATAGLTIPRHVAIVMDGSGRWGKNQGIVGKLPQRIAGHTRGVDSAKSVCRFGFHECGLPEISLWALSVKNVLGCPEKGIKPRPPEEIRHILHHCKAELQNDEYLKDGVRLQVIGNLSLFGDSELERLTAEAEERTKDCNKHTLNILLGYDGPWECTAALQSLFLSILKERKTITLDDWPEIQHGLTWGALAASAHTHKMRDVDLFIRTGSKDDPHNSGSFLVFLTGESQLIFAEEGWPDYGPPQLKRDIMEYSRRERRFGS